MNKTKLFYEQTKIGMNKIINNNTFIKHTSTTTFVNKIIIK